MITEAPNDKRSLKLIEIDSDLIVIGNALRLHRWKR